jgi:hypothetical protein
MDAEHTSAAEPPQTHLGKADLLRGMQDAWTNLNACLDTLTPEQMSEVRDAEGWTVKDHLIHLMAWERSGVLFLQGTPRFEGLGIDRTLLLGGDFDKMNAAIQQRWEALSAAEARAALNDVHAQLLRLVEAMSDDELQKGLSEYAPSTSGQDDARPISLLIYGDTTEHFQEHQQWIENLIAQSR